MRHGARFLAVMWLLAVIAFGGFFTVIGLASVVARRSGALRELARVRPRRDGGRPDRARPPVVAPHALTDAVRAAALKNRIPDTDAIRCEATSEVASVTEATVDQRQLVERARQGDHDAFAELARAAVVRLDRAARLILRDPELARDAVQDGLYPGLEGSSGPS